LVEAHDPTNARARARSLFAALALSLLLLGASVATTELLPPAESDPLALRWLRILAGHPWRSACALALIAWSLAPRPGPRAPPSPDRESDLSR
jgi:hypothetical protein